LCLCSIPFAEIVACFQNDTTIAHAALPAAGAPRHS